MPEGYDLDPASVALAAFIQETNPTLTFEDVVTRATRRGLRELALDALTAHERGDNALAMPREQ